MMINSSTKTRDKVVVTKDSIRAGGKEWEEVSKKLRIGPKYTVASVQGSFIWVYEIPGIKFSTLLFENTGSLKINTRQLQQEPNAKNYHQHHN